MIVIRLVDFASGYYGGCPAFLAIHGNEFLVQSRRLFHQFGRSKPMEELSTPKKETAIESDEVEMDAADTQIISSTNQEGGEDVIPPSCAEEEDVQSNDEAACVTLKDNIISDHDNDGSDLHSTGANGERANKNKHFFG